MDTTVPPNPILFWKEVEKRNAAAHDAAQPNASASKLKAFPPPSEQPPKSPTQIDSGAVYGAFNFWKTRDVEILKQDEENRLRRPFVAPAKVLKPADEALLKKPPIQAVRLRFLQKSKSTDSITTKATSELLMRKRPVELDIVKEQVDEEEKQKKEQKEAAEQIIRGNEEDESDDESDTLTDPEAVFEVLEEVLEGVLEGDNVTSLVYSKAAQKVKFKDQEELYGGIIINDETPITRAADEYIDIEKEAELSDDDDEGSKPAAEELKEDERPDEAAKEEIEEIKANGEIKAEEANTVDIKAEESDAGVKETDQPIEKSQDTDSSVAIVETLPEDKPAEPSEVPKPTEAEVEAEETKDSEARDAEARDSEDEIPRKDSTASSGRSDGESPTKGEPKSDGENEEKEEKDANSNRSSGESETKLESVPEDIDVNHRTLHISASTSAVPSVVHHEPMLAHPASTTSVGQVSDQIDESIVNSKSKSGTSLTTSNSREVKKGSRIIKRAGQLSKFITMRGDKDVEKSEKSERDLTSPTKKEKEKEKEKDKDKEKEKELKEREKETKAKEKEERKEKEKEERKEQAERKEKEKEERKEKEKEEKEKEHKGEKRKKGSSIFVKRDKKIPAISVDNLHSSSADPSPVSPPVSPRVYTEGQTFGVELEYLPYDEALGVPRFVASAIQILSQSEFEDVDYLYFDSETNPKILPLKALFNTEPLDTTKSYEHVLIAGLLKVFFVELPQPIVPQRLYTNFVDLQEIGEPAVYIGFLRSLVWALPSKHRVLLQFLVKFLRDKYLKNPANSKEYVMNKLGAAFGPSLIRPEDPQNTNVALSSAICRSIITNYENLFENFDAKDSVFKVRNNCLVLVHATLDRYVDRLLDPNYNEPEFLQLFFTIHQIFLTHNALLDLFNSLTSQNKTKGNKSWKQAMANRILDVVRQWMEFSYFELREDKALLSRIIRDFPPLEANYKAQHSKEKNHHLNFLNHLGARARQSVSNANIPILETSTVELAQHLTMVDFDLFCAVKPIEWLKYTEPFSSPDKKFPHLYAFQRQHSLWEYWTATEIVREPHVGLRVLRVAHFIKVALICREMNNHCTSLAIIAGLLHPGIRRLDCTWQILTKDMRDIFEQLVEWHKSESEKSVEEIITTLQVTRRPFLPSPITLHRLISHLNTLYPLNPSTAPNMLNLDRLRIIYAMMRAFQGILHHPYAMKAVPRLYIQLQEVSVLSGDQLMYKSMICEPPETPPDQVKLTPSKSAPTPTHASSPGLLITPSGGGYKVPEASNNWKAEVKRIWNKPVEQLPIGIDLPRLATSIFVPSSTPETPTGADGDVNMAPAAPAITEEAAPASAPEAAPAPPADEVDTRARDILHTLVNIGRFVEGGEYAQNLIDNFGNFVIVDGAKDRDMSREISRLVGEYLGKESKVVKVLKACNQAIIAPAVIELTLNVCAKVPFKDAGGWRMELTKNTEGLITVTHIKQQKQRSSSKEEEFNFEWHLEIIFDAEMTGLSDIFLSIPKLNFGPAVSQSTMEGIQYTFAPYLVRR